MTPVEQGKDHHKHRCCIICVATAFPYNAACRRASEDDAIETFRTLHAKTSVHGSLLPMQQAAEERAAVDEAACG